ncbi:MAG TPA: hypothetical protein PK405_00895, partial [Hyphomicrobiales bacterium]|nr:hypothetical protein [Hyphomicrobiales bacterium]
VFFGCGAAVLSGAGTVGLLWNQVLRRSPITHLIQSEPVAMRRERACQLGADTIIDPHEEDLATRVREIAPAADAATRTFHIEIEVKNGDGALRDGVTARMDIPLEPVAAHRLTSSYLTLNDAGTIGVRTVDEDGRVVFRAVQIFEDGPDGVWVGGLPEQVTVIISGQDFVREGERVTPIVAGAGDA